MIRMLALPLLRLSAILAPGASATVLPTSLNLTAVWASKGESTLECWQIGPLQRSADPGTSGAPFMFLGEVVNTTFTVLPPGTDGGLHNAPSFQFVFFASGLAHVTLPHSKDEAWVRGGKNGLIIAADTADVSSHGHRTEYPGGDNTVTLQIPIKNPDEFKRLRLHSGPCTEAEISAV
ncbi:hypothetical protein CDD83_4867 [Cordyceps sp. RAO-2017]|nr:hypothetical protein CDD83_4867 [Cordyceps sp. RAO-2017]